MSRMKKHVGQLTTTGVRCMVVFRTVPGDEQNCLVVETDHLPDMYHDNIVEIANSKESQETNNFHEILNRRTFGDGLNALQALHYKGYLRKVPVSQVALMPFPNQKLPLEMLNAQIDGKMAAYDDKQAEVKKASDEAKRKANPMSDPSDSVGVAQGLLIQADLLEAEAAKKRQDAYALAPSLAPSKVTEKSAVTTTAKAKSAPAETAERKRGRPSLSPEEKAIKAEERKAKRLERDRAKAVEKKIQKEEQKLQELVDAKVLRDAKRKAQEEV